MSPENCTGYNCRRDTEDGPCVTKVPHCCEDVVWPKQKLRRPPPNHAYKPPTLSRQTQKLQIQEEDDSSDEEMDDSESSEQDEPEEVRQHAFVQRRGDSRYVCARGCKTECGCRKLLHIHMDCHCPASGKLHWHEGVKSGRVNENQSDSLRQGSKRKS